MRARVAVSMCGTLMLSASVGRAQQGPAPVRLPEAEYPARDAALACARSLGWNDPRCPRLPAPEPVNPTARRHDGFFFRFGAGASYVAYSRASDSGVARSRGPGGGFDVQFGGTPWPGIVIGGGWFSPSAKNVGFVLGYDAFVQYYPDPRGGLHFQGLGGFAVVGEAPNIGGGIAAVGIGMDGWVGEQTSLGGLFRLGYAAGFGHGPAATDGTRPALTDACAFGSVEATFTWH